MAGVLKGTKHRGLAQCWRGLALVAVLLSAFGWAFPSPVVSQTASWLTVRGEASDSLLHEEVRSMAIGALKDYPPRQWPGAQAPLEIQVAPDRARFFEWADGRSPEWAAGIVLERGRVLLLEKSYLRDRQAARHLIRHEIAHIMLDRRLGMRPLPRWFHEGFAQIKAGEWDMQRLWQLSRAAWTKSAIPLSEMQRSFPYSGPRAQLAYAQSQAAVQLLIKDPPTFEHLLDLLRQNIPFGEALKISTGQDLLEFRQYYDDEHMPGYRRVSFLFGTGPLFFLMMVIFLLAAWRKMRRRRLQAGAATEDSGRFEWLARGWIDHDSKR